MSEIFIVDDDPLVDSALTMALNGEGFNVVNFVEGETFAWRAMSFNVSSARSNTCRTASTGAMKMSFGFMSIR